MLVDGHDVSNLRLRDYRSLVGVVMQDNFLFDGTVRDNIAFSRPGATDEEVRAAARVAHCDEFVREFDYVCGDQSVHITDAVDVSLVKPRERKYDKAGAASATAKSEKSDKSAAE